MVAANRAMTKSVWKLLVVFGIKTGRKPQSQEQTDVLGVGEAFGFDRPFQT